MATVLIISPESWADHTVSKHHYALTLARRGHDVLFLNPPGDSPDLIISRPIQSPLLRVIDGPPVARGLRYLPASARRLLEARWLQRLEIRIGARVDAVWLFENSRFYDMGFAGDRLKIYHQVDLNQNFHALAAARSADGCFCTTDIIARELRKASRRVHKIHHGTPVASSAAPLSAEQRELFGRSEINAAYIGNLAMEYIDADLLVRTAEAYPQVGFHFVGSYTERCALRVRTDGLPNVLWWGRQSSDLIPSVLAEVDVVMCTYQASRYREQLASPHKFMEYFASGKTIVATYTDEYKDKRDLLRMVDAREDYVAAFGEVIANLGSFNSPDRQERRRAFAAAHSYDAQLDRIIRILGEEIPSHADLLGPSRSHAVSEAVA